MPDFVTRTLAACALVCSAWFSLAPASLAQAPVKVACIGDSSTLGGANADGADNAWPQMLGRLLERTAPGRYEVRNFGATGATAIEISARPYSGFAVYPASLAYEPDIVIVNLGSNDARPVTWDLPGADFEGDYRNLVDTYRALPSEPEVYVSTLIRLPYWSTILPGVEPNLPAVSRAISDVAQEAGLGVLDFDAVTSADPLLVPDGVHTSSYGNERVAAAAHLAITSRTSRADASIRFTPVQGTEERFVAAGVADGLSLGSWTQEAGSIEGRPGVGTITLPLTLGDDDFHLRTRLRMLDQTTSNAHLVFNGNQFGFESLRESVFRDGPDFLNVRFLFPSDHLWDSGDWIDVELVRNDGTVWFVIEGEVAVIAPIDGPATSFGLNPGSSTMQVESWSVVHAPRDGTALALTTRTFDTPWIDLSERDDLVRSYDRKPEPTPGPDWTIESPDGSEVARIDAVADPGSGRTFRAEVRTSVDQGASYSPPRLLPVALGGLRHAATKLADGRVALAFWDLAAESPTAGDLVLWCGTYDQLVEGVEGEFTCRLTRDWRISADVTFLEVREDASGDVVVLAQGRSLASGAELLVEARVPLDEVEALVPRADAQGAPLARGPLGEAFTLTTAAPNDIEAVAVAALAPPVDQLIAAVLYADFVWVVRSFDDGRTWSLPFASLGAANGATGLSLDAVPLAGGGERLVIALGGETTRVAHSDDAGATWSAPAVPFVRGTADGFDDVTTDASGQLVAAFDGTWKHVLPSHGPPRRAVFTTRSADAGVTWTKPTPVFDSTEVLPAEPCFVRSPDGSTLALLFADGGGRRGAFVMFSEDGGAWSPPRELATALRGIGHAAAYASSGELVITSRAQASTLAGAGALAAGTWVAWLGSWDDLVFGTAGEGRAVLRRRFDGEDDAIETSLARGNELYAVTVGRAAPLAPRVAVGIPFTPQDVRDALADRPGRTTVYRSTRRAAGPEAHTYRAPALTVTPSGDVLAFADARRVRGDELPGELDLVARRSADGGQTFAADVAVVTPPAGEGASRSCVLNDTTTGSIACAAMTSTGVGLFDSNTGFGNDTVRNVVATSPDDGATWSPAVDVTMQVKDAAWRAAWIRGGAGVVDPSGRWILPVEVHDGAGAVSAQCATSDDAGATWQRRGALAVDSSDPSFAVRAGGDVLASVRVQGMRSILESQDGAASWTTLATFADLIEERSPSSFTVAEASATPDGLEWWIVAGPAAASAPLRRDLTLHVSRDAGATWSATVLHLGPSGEASLAWLPNGDLGVLAEVGTGHPYERIDLFRVDLETLVP